MDPLIVLIVEDDETTRRALTRMLGKDERVSALSAPDGLEALGILESQPVDVVISDEVMPKVNGIRLLETIKGRWPGTRRVLYTGHANAEIVMDAINRGGVDKALSKAMPPDQFREEIGEILDDVLSQRLGGAPRTSGLFTPSAAPEQKAPHSVMVVGDQLAVRREIETSLRSDGFHVASVNSHDIASALAEEKSDVVIVDLSGSATTAQECLLGVRSADLHCPVVVLAARSDVAKAHEAVAMGAHRYLVHPVGRDALSRVAKRAATVNRLSKARREAVAEMRGDAGGMGDRIGLELRFKSALEKLYMAYQPIVRWSERRIIGYEALVRSDEKSMPHPGVLLDAATRLSRMPQLSATIRRVAPKPFLDRDDDLRLFLNVHVSDVSSDDLLQSPLVEMAGRVVLEITERASLDSVPNLRGHVSALRASGYKVAVDDLGAGYAGLSSFAALDPDIVKLDMSLVRDVHTSPTKQRLVKSLQEACADLGVPMVAEGVETAEERDALVKTGCDVFQGYLFGRPERELAEVSWG